MDLSHFLAQLMGVSLVIFAVAGFLRPQLVSAALRDFDHESFSTLSIGFIAVIAGLAVVLSHNVWEASWRVIVTLFGWSSLIKGSVYLLAPHSLIRVGKPLFKNETWTRSILVGTLIVGAYLAYKGFGS
jgi:hypothetical protein